MKQKQKHSILKSCSKIEPLEKQNGEFQLCKIYLQSVGKNRNFSVMSKENIQKNIPTISYAPVVGHLLPKTDSDGKLCGYYFGGHDYEFDAESLSFKPLTVPFGVVVKDSWDFEVIQELGEDKEYVTVLCYLWVERYPELKEAIYSDEVWFAQSMEISVDSWKIYENDSNYTELVDWTYSAACILGKSDNGEHPEWNCEPCFIESKIMPIQYSISQENFSTLMNEMKCHLAECFEANSNIEKGGKNMTNEIRDLVLSEAGLVLDDLGFEVTNEMTEDEFRCKVDEIKKKKNACQNHSAATDAQDDETNTGTAANEENEINAPKQSKIFGLTYREKFDEILEQVRCCNIVDDDGRYLVDYWLQDFDDSYAYVSIDDYRNDCYQHSYGRFSYVISDDGYSIVLETEVETVVCKWLTIDECDEIEKQRGEYELLSEYKAQRLEDDRKEAYELVLNEFADLSMNEEYQALLKNPMKFDSSDSLRKECFAIRGKSFVLPTRASNAEVTIRIEGKNNEDIPYGGFFTKYLPNAERRK